MKTFAGWLGEVESSPWFYRVQSASGPEQHKQAVSAPILSIGEAVNACTEMHKHGLRARVIRVRIQREIVDTIGLPNVRHEPRGGQGSD